MEGVKWQQLPYWQRYIGYWHWYSTSGTDGLVLAGTAMSGIWYQWLVPKKSNSWILFWLRLSEKCLSQNCESQGARQYFRCLDKWCLNITISIWPICQCVTNTQNLSETEFETFSVSNFFPILNLILFLIPNLTDRESGTFSKPNLFDTESDKYLPFKKWKSIETERFWNRNVTQNTQNLTETKYEPFSRYQIFTIPNPILF